MSESSAKALRSAWISVLSNEDVMLALVDESLDGIVIVGTHGRILLVNATLATMFGYNPSDLIGEPLEILVPEGRRRAHRAHRATFACAPESRPMGSGLDLSARRRDGTIFPVEVGLAAVDTPTDRLFIATVRDISDRHASIQAQQELERLNAISAVVSLHRSLTTAVSLGQGLRGIADAVRLVTGGTVVVEDLEGTASAWAGGVGGEQPGPSSRRGRGILRSAPHAQAFRDGDWLTAVARPDGEVRGAISLIDPDANAGEAAAFALEQAATVLAMELFRLRSIVETELKVWGDLASELLDDADLTRSRAHASALGYDIDTPHRAVLIQLDGSPASDLVPAVGRIARHLKLDRTLVTPRSAGLVLLLDRDLDWHELGKAVAQERGGSRRVGVGGRHGPDTIRRSLDEAQLALRLSTAPVALFDSLGVWRFLAADAEPARLQEFVRDWIGVLIDYDASRNADLVSTLAAYLAGSGSLAVTARGLHVHPSTLKYRLRRVRELTGRNIRDSEDRFNLDLACRAHATSLALVEDG